MTEPPRLLDHASGLERAVLESASDDEPSPERRRRIVASLGVSSVGFFSLTRVAQRIASWKIAFWKVVVGTALIGGVGIGSAVVSSRPSSSMPVVVSSTPAPTAVVSAAPTGAIEPTPLRVVSTAPMRAVEPLPSHVVPSAAATTGLPKKSTRDSRIVSLSIGREIALIDRARASFAQGDPKEALQALDEYDLEFRDGALSLESAILRIEALAAEGELDLAASEARAFLKKHPHSAYDARVQAHLPNP